MTEDDGGWFQTVAQEQEYLEWLDNFEEGAMAEPVNQPVKENENVTTNCKRYRKF